MIMSKRQAEEESTDNCSPWGQTESATAWGQPAKIHGSTKWAKKPRATGEDQANRISITCGGHNIHPDILTFESKKIIIAAAKTAERVAQEGVAKIQAVVEGGAKEVNKGPALTSQEVLTRAYSVCWLYCAVEESLPRDGNCLKCYRQGPLGYVCQSCHHKTHLQEEGAHEHSFVALIEWGEPGDNFTKRFNPEFIGKLVDKEKQVGGVPYADKKDYTVEQYPTSRLCLDHPSIRRACALKAHKMDLFMHLQNVVN